MSDEVENHTVRLLQEMRGEVRSVRQDMVTMGERFTDLTQRIDGNTLVFNLVAGVVHGHEGRIGALEGGRS